MTDLIIIGGGPAGMTAAIYACRAGLSVLVLDKFSYGGQVALTGEVENYPGVPGADGAQLSALFHRQAVEAGAQFTSADIQRVELEGPVKKVFARKKEFESRAVIIANGVTRRKIGCPGEEAFAGRGVSYCATCDGAFYRDKTAVVVGGGNTAVGDALYLSAVCKKVWLVHRRDSFRAEKYLSDALAQKENVSYLLGANVTEISGDQQVRSVRCKTAGGEEKTLETDAVFVAIGAVPDNAIYAGQLDLDAAGYFAAGEDCKTRIPGVYVAGDCRVKPIKQIVTATADGAVAATFAAEYIHALA